MCNDPENDKFLGAAIAAHARHLMTGNRNLLRTSHTVLLRRASMLSFLRRRPSEFELALGATGAS